MNEKIIVLQTSTMVAQNKNSVDYLDDHGITLDDVMQLAVRIIRNKLDTSPCVDTIEFTPLEMDRIIAEISVMVYNVADRPTNQIVRGAMQSVISECHRVAVLLLDVLITSALSGPLMDYMRMARNLEYRGRQGWDMVVGVLNAGTPKYIPTGARAGRYQPSRRF